MTILQSARDEIAKVKPGDLLELDDYAFFDSDMEELVSLLKKYKHTRVSIKVSNISDSGAALLAGCTDLIYLAIDRNNVGDEGVRHLLTLPNLRELHICSNNLSDIGARLINDKCGPNFCAKIYGNDVSASLIKEIERKGREEYNPDAPKVQPQPKESGYSPRQWKAARDSTSSSSSASSTDDMRRAASDSPKPIGKPSSSSK